MKKQSSMPEPRIKARQNSSQKWSSWNLQAHVKFVRHRGAFLDKNSCFEGRQTEHCAECQKTVELRCFIRRKQGLTPKSLVWGSVLGGLRFNGVQFLKVLRLLNQLYSFISVTLTPNAFVKLCFMVTPKEQSADSQIMQKREARTRRALTTRHP